MRKAKAVNNEVGKEVVPTSYPLTISGVNIRMHNTPGKRGCVVLGQLALALRENASAIKTVAEAMKGAEHNNSVGIKVIQQPPASSIEDTE